MKFKCDIGLLYPSDDLISAYERYLKVRKLGIPDLTNSEHGKYIGVLNSVKLKYFKEDVFVLIPMVSVKKRLFNGPAHNPSFVDSISHKQVASIYNLIRDTLIGKRITGDLIDIVSILYKAYCDLLYLDKSNEEVDAPLRINEFRGLLYSRLGYYCYSVDIIEEED
jgi:hypothetical protein